MADLANIAAATTAGYKEIVVQRNDGKYTVILEKTVPGAAGQNLSLQKHYGEGASQAAAETAALAALNPVRDERSRKLGGSIDAR